MEHRVCDHGCFGQELALGIAKLLEAGTHCRWLESLRDDHCLCRIVDRKHDTCIRHGDDHGDKHTKHRAEIGDHDTYNDASVFFPRGVDDPCRTTYRKTTPGPKTSSRGNYHHAGAPRARITDRSRGKHRDTRILGMGCVALEEMVLMNTTKTRPGNMCRGVFLRMSTLYQSVGLPHWRSLR